MKLETVFFCAFLALGVGCSKKEEVKPTTDNNSSGNPVTAPVDYLGAVAKGKKFAEKQIDLATLKQGIQQFEANEGRFPKDLDELYAKRYIGAPAKAPYGMRLIYEAISGEVKIIKTQ